MQEVIIQYFSSFPKEWAIFWLSMIPVTELRAAIPLAITKLGMTPVEALFYAVIGNTFMGAMVVLIVEPFVHFFVNNVNFLKFFWEKYINRIKTKNVEKFEEWGAIILIIFIAIPLPMTGAFTGAVAASIFEIPFRKAVPMIFAGCLIAGLIVTGLTLGVQGIF